MVVRRFSPYKNYKKGIIKYIFTNVDKNWAQIYPTAFLDDGPTYYQSVSSNTYLNMTFKKYLFFTHFAAMSRVSLNAAWDYPKNFSVTGCMNDACIVLDSIINSERYNVTTMTLKSINPGTFNFISININNCINDFN